MPAVTAVAVTVGSSYFAMLVGVVQSILVMRYLGPTFQGVRRIVDLITKYAFNVHLGILHGVSKQLPIHLGEHDAEKVQDVEEVGFSWVMGLTLVASLVMVGVGLMNPTGQKTTGIAIAIGGGWLLTQQAINLYRIIIRAWGNFALLGVIGGVQTVLTFTGTVYGARHHGVLGAMAGSLLAWMATLGLFMAYSPARVTRPRFDVRIGLSLARAGVPIAAYILADTLLRTVDATIVAGYYRAYQMGLYSLPLQIAGYLYAIPESAGFVIWPRILEAYGAAAGDARAMRRQILLPTLVAAYLMPVLAGLAYIMLPPLVLAVVPKFQEAIPAGQVLALASVFLALPMASNSLLIALDRNVTVIATKLLGAAVSALGCLWLVHHSGSLAQLAGAAGMGYAVAALVSVAVVLPHYTAGRLDTLTVFLGMLVPFGWSAVALALSSLLAGAVLASDPASWAWALCRALVFGLLMLPVLVIGNRQTNLARELALLRRATTPAKEVMPDE
ncbi:MAG: oligosaccharide flippase family protein [Armatimonadetes bacterium]|nr:oligosaccharide flippase family protein [Armatimonadota bacterium]